MKVNGTITEWFPIPIPEGFDPLFPIRMVSEDSRGAIDSRKCIVCGDESALLATLEMGDKTRVVEVSICQDCIPQTADDFRALRDKAMGGKP